MSTNRPSKVVVIDDEPEEQRPVFRNLPPGAATFEVIHPEEIDSDQLNSADLVLVDYVLTHWPERDEQKQIGLAPQKGLSLCSVLREQLNADSHPTGFALQTGQPEKLWITPAESRQHVIARAYNLEWVFLKSDSTDVIRQASILADAIRALPSEWPGDNHNASIKLVLGLLKIDQPVAGDDLSQWSPTALAEISSCCPPLTELSERNHGLVFLRWMLHRILPYPCFLLDSHRLAARLRVTHESLLIALKTKLGTLFENCRYTGVLADFLGARWWRAGIEDALWDLTEGVTVAPGVLREKMEKITASKLVASSSESPVVCVGADFQQLPEACAPEDVVRIQPDDWPPYASQAWTTVTLAKDHPRLAAVVVEDDINRVFSK